MTPGATPKAKPVRVQLRRAKGWRMPENTVKVDRSTMWGNPFVVGRDGTREECVRWFGIVFGGTPRLCISMPTERIRDQELYHGRVRLYLPMLRGKNLACWCPLDAPCHADVLLELANR